MPLTKYQSNGYVNHAPGSAARWPRAAGTLRPAIVPPSGRAGPQVPAQEVLQHNRSQAPRLEVPQPAEPSTPVVPDAPVTPADPDPGTPADPEEPATVPTPQEPATPVVPEPDQPAPGTGGSG